MVLGPMTLLEFRGVAEAWSESLQPSEPSLTLDDVLSYSSDDLGLEVDDTGNLILIEGVDFE